MATRKDFRTAWLLFLLRRGGSYGYELRRELGLRGFELDPAVLYRSLREMESSGMIASRWVRSEAGPRRRVYAITAAGETELARIAASLRELREAHDAFLAVYDPDPARGAPGARHDG